MYEALEGLLLQAFGPMGLRRVEAEVYARNASSARLISWLDTQPVYAIAAPLERYLERDEAGEIALARSAAPPSLSAEARVLVLCKHGYETAAEGNNGFVCFVQWSWTARVDDSQFWNPCTRAATCFNALASRTELPQYLKRTEWVLAGESKERIIEKTRAALRGHSFLGPQRGRCLSCCQEWAT